MNVEYIIRSYSSHEFRTYFLDETIECVCGNKFNTRTIEDNLTAGSQVLVAISKYKLVGFLIYEFLPRQKQIFVKILCSMYRGFGTILLNEIKEIVKSNPRKFSSIILEPLNESLVPYYLKQGFYEPHENKIDKSMCWYNN